MRTVLLMAAFGLGSLLLLPRQGLSLDDCVPCPCKEMKAWKTVDPKASDPRPAGMRMPDPGDPTKTIPVAHAPYNDVFNGWVLAAVPDAGKHKGQSVEYRIYRYTKAPVLDCNVKEGEKQGSIVRVDFANAADWDAIEVIPDGLRPLAEWQKCVP